MRRARPLIVDVAASPRRLVAASSSAVALLCICMAAGVHMRCKEHRAELELTLLARYDRWGIPIDEAVDNHAGSSRTRSDKMMLKTVQALENKMDALSAQVTHLGAKKIPRKSIANQAEQPKPVVKHVVKVHDAAEMSALNTIQSDIRRLITVDADKRQPAQTHTPAAVPRTFDDHPSAQRRKRTAEARQERKATELKDVEKRTMEAVKDAMARQRALDMQEAAEETERRRAARRKLEEHEHQPETMGHWGRRDGEAFDTYLGKSRRSSVDGGRAVGRNDDDQGVANRRTHHPELSTNTAVTASRSKLAADTGSIRDGVLRLEKREQFLEGQERQALNELPEISNDEAHAESSVASTMQTLQIAKDRRVLAKRAVEDDTYNTGPAQAMEDRSTLITATKTQEEVSAKLKVDLHALAQAKLDAKRGPILAQALHRVRGELMASKDKMKIWDQVQEAQALERSKDFAAR